MATNALTARSRRTRAALVTAVHDRLAARGRFTAEEIASDVGCTPGTFWSHFTTKDDAISQAFEVALAELEELARDLFSALPPVASRHDDTLLSWSEHTVSRLIAYFTDRALIYRSTLARIPEHRPILHALRDAEARITELIEDQLGGHASHDDAVTIVVFLQGLNNPAVLTRVPTPRTVSQLARALATLVEPSAS